MLKDDRIGALNDGSGDDMAERLVNSSLNSMDKQTIGIFLALGAAPEDVAVPLPAAQVIAAAGADSAVAEKGEINAIVMRRSVKALLDRNLLVGAMATGVWMHDVSCSCVA